MQNNSTRAGLEREINHLFQRLCSCSESLSVEITAYECSSSRDSLSLEGILVYSDEEGRITASTLIDLLTLRTLSARPPTLFVDGVQYTLQVSQNTCPSSLQNVCFESFMETNSPEKNVMGVFSGLFVGGFVAGVILNFMVCAIVITW